VKLMSGTADDDALRAIALRFGEAADAKVSELMPVGLVRSFRVGNTVLRVDAGPGDALAREGLVLRALEHVTSPRLTAEWKGAGTDVIDGSPRGWLAYAWLKGTTLDETIARESPALLGALYGRLHATHVLDLWSTLRERRPMTLLDAFKRLSEQLKSWMLTREGDGLAPDLLVLSLSDLQRAIRQSAVAQDRLFQVSRRRVLLHGRPSPDAIVAVEEGDTRTHHFVLLDQTTLGDASEDIAAFAVSAGFNDVEEDLFLDAYLDVLEAHGRPDTRFIPRYFARKSVALLASPIEKLARMGRIKAGREPLFEDPVVTIEKLEEQTISDLVRAFNGLRGYVGGSRPVTHREVVAMGRLVAYEEMILDGRTFRIALTGLPYAGKTEVGATLARRLKHAYINTSVVGRALALFEKRQGKTSSEPRALVAELFAAGFDIEPTVVAPYYCARIAGEDVTLDIHEDKEQLRGAALLDDPIVRLALKDAIEARFATQGMVVEGAYAQDLVSGRVRSFHLICDTDVRRARLINHRPDVANDADADALLARLDETAEKPPADAATLDCGSRPAAAAALEILWHLLPASRRPDRQAHGMSGRTPLYAR
jgi:cytidylate kinase